MPIIDIRSFLEDVGLEPCIPEIGISEDDLDKAKASVSGGSYVALERAARVNRILRECTNMVNIPENSKVTHKIAAEVVDVIQLVRRAVYKAIRDSIYETDEIETGVAQTGTEDKKEKDISKAQKSFDIKFKCKLKHYLLEAQANNFVNKAYMEFEINRGTIENKITPISSELMNCFVNKICTGGFFYHRFELDDFTEDSVKYFQDDYEENYIRDICAHIVPKILKSGFSLNNSRDEEVHERFCNSIFDNDPSVESKKILLPGYPEIKEDVLVSFLRIILYPFKFIVDYLEKKRIYGLDELRLFKDGKEKPREKEASASVKQKRLFNYGSLEEDSSVNSLGKDEFLRAVELEKGKKQHYAVFNCFEKGIQPPNGTVIVFHGKNADIHTKPFIDSYKSICEGYRVIMMEYPGFKPSSGPLSKENISDVTYKLFEDAKKQGLIKGDLTVMGDEGFGCYYAALLAKNINEKEPGFCKGLVISESFNSANSDLSRFGKIASYISDDERLNTDSVLQELSRTMPITLLVSNDKILDRIYTKKEEGKEAPLPYSHNLTCLDHDVELPVLNYRASDAEISKAQDTLNGYKEVGLKNLRYLISGTEALVYGKKPFSAFLSASASKVGDQKEQGLAK